MTATSGCLSSFRGESTESTVVSVRYTEQRDNPTDKADLSVNGDTATISGTFAAQSVCVDLSMTTYTSTPEDGIVVADIIGQIDKQGCDGPAAIGYETELMFGFPIRDLKLNHVSGGERTTPARYNPDA
jgi:hypothetical protein